MRTVFKYARAVDDLNDVIYFQIPVGAQILSAINQRERLCVYALVDTESPSVPTAFRVAGTGNILDGEDLGEFVDTVSFFEGSFVVHVFQMKP